jgi:predicted metal-dependent phosphoesterase TrpH
LIDLHLHTTASDGMLAPRELVARAALAGLSIISVTDHDTIAGFDEARFEAQSRRMELVPGIEITAVEDSRDVHVLGYFFDPQSATLTSFLEDQRADRLRRVRAMAERLAGLGSPIDTAPLFAAASAYPGRSIGRPQIADALVRAGHARDRNDAFDRLLGNGCAAYVPRCVASPDEVVSILAGAGGIASLAHPGLSRIDGIIPRVAASGLAALEVRHSDHDEPTERRYREMAASLGLAVTAGSDFHGDGGHRVAQIGSVTLAQAEFEALKARVR